MRFNANDKATFRCVDSEWNGVGAIGCTVIRPLTNEEADLNETGPMYEISLDRALSFGNGVFDTYHAFEDELEPIE